MDTVYDAEVIAKANGDLAGRRRGNALDIRLSHVEAFIGGERRALYNQKLLGEYAKHVKSFRNDAIEAFLTKLADHGHKSPRSKLSRPDFVAATSLGWPSHDQHLLAAALAGERTTVLVIEDVLSGCAAGVKRRFRLTITRV